MIQNFVVDVCLKTNKRVGATLIKLLKMLSETDFRDRNKGFIYSFVHHLQVACLIKYNISAPFSLLACLLMIQKHSMYITQ